MKQTKIKLHGVSETMLIPLYARAVETGKPNAAFRDALAVKMIQTMEYDFSKFAKGKMSMWGVAARTTILDAQVKRFIAQHPEATCINVGCGLDTRFSRVDNGKITWYDLDLPEAMAVREQMIPAHERVTRIADSVLSASWISQIADKKDVLIIFEGILMYFDEAQVKQLFYMLCDAFPHAVILAELSSKSMIRHQKRHDTLKQTNAVFHWGVTQSKDVETLCPRLRLEGEWNLTRFMKRYSPLFLTLISPILKKCNNRIARFAVRSEMAHHLQR